MSDPYQANMWPQYQEPPPWSDVPAQPTAATPATGPPEPIQQDAWPGQDTAGTGSASNVRPNYQLPPDLVAPTTGWAAGAQPSPWTATEIPTHPPLNAPSPAPSTSPTRPQPLLIAGAAALALVVGVALTVLITQTWASSRGTTTGTTTQAAPAPTTGNRVDLADTDPGAALIQLAADDRSSVALIPDGYWVPQLSSKRVGLVADGITYGDQDILEDHNQIRRANPGAALLSSGDYITFSSTNFWVTILPSEYSSSAEGANQWCASQGFDGDHCYAKRISATSYFNKTTQNR